VSALLLLLSLLLPAAAPPSLLRDGDLALGPPRCSGSSASGTARAASIRPRRWSRRRPSSTTGGGYRYRAGGGEGLGRGI